MKLKPTRGRLYIEQEPAESVTASGLIIPDRAKEKPLVGKIVAIGAGCGSDYAVGDRVIFGKFAGQEFEPKTTDYEGRKILIVKRAEVLAVVEPRRCGTCGCSDDDCSGCVAKTGAPCHWVDDELCSACAK